MMKQTKSQRGEDLCKEDVWVPIYRVLLPYCCMLHDPTSLPVDESRSSLGRERSVMELVKLSNLI